MHRSNLSRTYSYVRKETDCWERLVDELKKPKYQHVDDKPWYVEDTKAKSLKQGHIYVKCIGGKEYIFRFDSISEIKSHIHNTFNEHILSRSVIYCDLGRYQDYIWIDSDTNRGTIRTPTEFEIHWLELCEKNQSYIKKYDAEKLF